MPDVPDMHGPKVPPAKAMKKIQNLKTRFAKTEADITAAQQLRYRVFVDEMGAVTSRSDHDHHLEVDPFDAHADHLLLCDLSRDPSDQVVGTYRLMSSQQARSKGFSSDAEFDHSALTSSGRPLLELSRSCVDPDYRDGVGMFLLWQALSDFITEQKIEVLFGVASFWERDPQKIAAPLSLLHHRHLAPEPLLTRCHAPATFDLIPDSQIDRIAALKEIPALIKAYLRLGGLVGEGAFVDESFGTVDVSMVVDMNAITPRQRMVFARSVS